MQRFKERLRFRRNALGWSQSQLALKSGVSERAIAGYESKGNAPTGSVLEKLAETLGCAPSWLMGGEAEPMHLSDAPRETDAELWRRRAITAERELANLKSAMRELLTTPPIVVDPTPTKFEEEQARATKKLFSKP